MPTLRDHVASQDQMVVLVVEVDLLQQMLQLLPAPMNIADKDESPLLLRQVLLVHVADLDHAPKVGAHVAPIAHSWCGVHGL